MFTKWLSASSLPEASSLWYSGIDQGEQIVESSSSAVFSRSFKEAFVERLAVAVGEYEANRIRKKEEGEAEDQKLAAIVGAPFSVVVAGAAGLGKSTLINSVFDVNVAEAGGGRPVTAAATAFNDPTGFARIIDTQGFCPTFRPDDLISFITSAASPESTLPHFDMVWYFIDRIHEDDAKVLSALLQQQVPFLVIISKCDAKDQGEINTIRSQIHAILSPPQPQQQQQESNHEDAAIDTLIHSLELDSAIRGWDIVELRNPPQTTSGLKCDSCGSVKANLLPLSHPSNTKRWKAWYCATPTCPFSQDLYLKIQDVRSLRDSLSHLSGSLTALLNNIPTRRFLLARLQTDNSTHLTQIAIKIVTTATLTAAGIGAAPIPFADMPFLLATQTTMILSICRVFGIPALLDPMLYLSILAASPFPFLGILCAGAVKTIPGVGSIAAGVIEAPIAGGMTLAMGVAVIQTCVQIYKTRLEGGGQKTHEFRFDASVQKRVQGSLKGTVDWVKKAVMGGGFTEKAVGEHIRKAVGGKGKANRGEEEGVEVPMLEFDKGGVEVEEEEATTPLSPVVDVNVEAIAAQMKERNVQPEQVVQVLLANKKDGESGVDKEKGDVK
ncbi:UNVERIFIED_CONTAM: hypothetical protein HDU68_002982 [Siphonaria sp. JEL0065]|nr:hypothetical protein HDU68_002982 [Siphonaria sp. JEL0065]